MDDHLPTLTVADRRALCAFLRHSAAVDDQFPGLARDAPDKRRWADAIEAEGRLIESDGAGNTGEGE